MPIGSSFSYKLFLKDAFVAFERFPFRPTSTKFALMGPLNDSNQSFRADGVSGIVLEVRATKTPERNPSCPIRILAKRALSHHLLENGPH